MVDQTFHTVNHNSESAVKKATYGNGSFSDRQVSSAPKKGSLTITASPKSGKTSTKRSSK